MTKKILILLSLGGFLFPLFSYASTSTDFIAVNDCNFRATSPVAGGAYDTARNASTSAPDNSSAMSGTADNTKGASNWAVGRAIYKFNTTSLPPEINVLSATLKIKSAGGTDTIGNQFVVATQHSSVGAGDCAATDYERSLFVGNLSEISLDSWISASGTVESFILNTSTLQVNTSTYTSLGIRMLADIDDVAPSSTGDNLAQGYFKESTGNEPMLTLVWEVASSTASSTATSTGVLNFTTPLEFLTFLYMILGLGVASTILTIKFFTKLNVF